MEYRPGGTATKSNSPAEDEDAWRTASVARLRSSIEAFGTTDPAGSVITPTTAPASNCAQARVEAKRAKQAAARNIRFTFGALWRFKEIIQRTLLRDFKLCQVKNDIKRNN
jgi:hypothetical protein